MKCSEVSKTVFSHVKTMTKLLYGNSEQSVLKCSRKYPYFPYRRDWNFLCANVIIFCIDYGGLLVTALDSGQVPSQGKVNNQRNLLFILLSYIYLFFSFLGPLCKLLGYW